MNKSKEKAIKWFKGSITGENIYENNNEGYKDFEVALDIAIQETVKQYEEKIKVLKKCNLIYKRSYARECAINKGLKQKFKKRGK